MPDVAPVPSTGPATVTTDAALHDIFISYSRKDTPFAVALHRALERYVPPKGLPVPHRRLNVFRDADDFTGTEYFASVEQHLRQSRRLVVISSPHAHQSEYVNDEIRRFSQARSASDIIPVLISGIPNNEATPETLSAVAFPEALCGLLKMPLAADYRGFDPATDRVSSKRWWPAWHKLLADICGCSRAEIEERERKRRFRRNLIWAGSTSVGVVVVGGLLYLANDQRRSANSLALARSAMGLADSDPELGTSRALQALALANSTAATSALRINLAKLPSMQLPAAKGYDLSSPAGVAFAPQAKQMLIADRQPKARIVDMQTGGTLFDSGGSGPPIVDGEWSPDGTLIAVIDEQRKTTLLNAATGARVSQVDGELHWRKQKAGAKLSAVVLTDKTIKLVELDQSGGLKQLREISPTGYSGPRITPFDSSSRTLSPDRGKLATLMAEREPARVIISDIETGQRAQVTIPSPSGLQGLSWSPDGRYLAANSLFGFSIIEVEGVRIWFTQNSESTITVEDVGFSPDGKLLATTDRGGVTTLWSVPQKKKTEELVGEADRAYRPKFSPDGRFLGVIYANGLGRVFSVDHHPKGGVARLASTWGEISSVDFTPDSGAILAFYERGTLAIWDLLRWFPERRLAMKFDPRFKAGVAEGLADIRLASEGPIVGIQQAAAFRGWNAATGEEVPTAGRQFKRLADAIAAEKGGYSLRRSGSDVLITGSTGAVSLRLPHVTEVRSATFSEDGQCVLTSSAFRRNNEAPPDADVVRLWDTETGSLLREWTFSQWGPETAFFANRERAVALYESDAFVFRTPLCGSVAALVDVARERMSRQTTTGR